MIDGPGSNGGSQPGGTSWRGGPAGASRPGVGQGVGGPGANNPAPDVVRTDQLSVPTISPCCV